VKWVALWLNRGRGHESGTQGSGSSEEDLVRGGEERTPKDPSSSRGQRGAGGSGDHLRSQQLTLRVAKEGKNTEGSKLDHETPVRRRKRYGGKNRRSEPSQTGGPTEKKTTNTSSGGKAKPLSLRSDKRRGGSENCAYVREKYAAKRQR